MSMEFNRRTRTEVFLLKLYIVAFKKTNFFPLASRKSMHTNICTVIVIDRTQGITLCCNKKSDNRIVSLNGN